MYIQTYINFYIDTYIHANMHVSLNEFVLGHTGAEAGSVSPEPMVHIVCRGGTEGGEGGREL